MIPLSLRAGGSTQNIYLHCAVTKWLPLEAAPFLTFPRKRGKGLVGQNKSNYAPNPTLARVSPFPRLRGKVRKGAAFSGTLSES